MLLCALEVEDLSMEASADCVRSGGGAVNKRMRAACHDDDVSVRSIGSVAELAARIVGSAAQQLRQVWPAAPHEVAHGSGLGGR